MTTKLLGPAGAGIGLALVSPSVLASHSILDVFVGSLVMGLISIVILLGAGLLLIGLIERSLASLLIGALWLGMPLWETRQMLVTEEVVYARLGGVLALLVVLSMVIVLVGAHLARLKRHRPLVKAWRQPLLDAIDQAQRVVQDDMADAMAPGLESSLVKLRQHIRKARYYDGDHPLALLRFREALRPLEAKAPYSALTRRALAPIREIDVTLPRQAPHPRDMSSQSPRHPTREVQA